MTEETIVTPNSEATAETKFWFDEFKEKFNQLEKHVILFYQKEKKKSAAEARKFLQDLRELAKVGRTHIQATKAAPKTKD